MTKYISTFVMFDVHQFLVGHLAAGCRTYCSMQDREIFAVETAHSVYTFSAFVQDKYHLLNWGNFPSCMLIHSVQFQCVEKDL